VITRFDHAVIGVRDLDLAGQAFCAAGFEVRPGGRHTGRGTHNALIRFGLDYIELISVYDRDEAIASGLGGGHLVEFLDREPGDLVGYCLATDDIESLARTIAASVPGTGGAFAMSRLRPDGQELRWRIALSGPSPWLTPYPFLIQWELGDEARLQLEATGHHALGAVSVAGIEVVSSELSQAATVYTQVFGLKPAAAEGSPPRPKGARFAVGNFVIDLVEGPANREGPIALKLAVRDLQASRDWLGKHQVPYDSLDEGVVLDQEAVAGARIILVAG
jgi:Glyoxalase-like domain